MTKRILKLPDVIVKTALSRSSIYDFINKNKFPKPISLGVRAVGFIEDEIDAWISQKAKMREETHAAK